MWITSWGRAFDNHDSFRFERKIYSLTFDHDSAGSDKVKVRLDEDLLMVDGLLRDRLQWLAALVKLLEVDPIKRWQQRQDLDLFDDVPNWFGRNFEPATGIQGGKLNSARIRDNSLARNLQEVFICQLLEADMLKKEKFNLKILEKTFFSCNE